MNSFGLGIICVFISPETLSAALAAASTAAVTALTLPCIFTALALGGGVRVGLEDTGFYAKGVVATNEMLVQRAARIVREFGCEPATPDEAREMLSMKKK
ncbi:MAG: 3-keto-5-aminohexanoate cleavage protein [Oscillospiraceae bacterium]|nr:3-keto-5-aminohexanoate cleavage protein [Oscillospiraceae bacterium]